jgi:hypothetical protein
MGEIRPRMNRRRFRPTKPQKCPEHCCRCCVPTARDGEGKDSRFATALAHDIKEHVEVRKLFDIVRDDAWTATKHDSSRPLRLAARARGFLFRGR